MNVAKLPKISRHQNERPPLARISERAWLLDQVVTGDRGVVVEVHLQSAELIENIVRLAADWGNVGRLWRLLAGSGNDEGRGSGCAAASFGGGYGAGRILLRAGGCAGHVHGKSA